MYQKGEGVPQDPQEAFRLFRLVADQGFGRAQQNLGVMCQNGEGVQQNYKEATKWYRLAAKQGDDFAQGKRGKRHKRLMNEMFRRYNA